jgi:hypothetical protein
VPSTHVLHCIPAVRIRMTCAAHPAGKGVPMRTRLTAINPSHLPRPTSHKNTYVRHSAVCPADRYRQIQTMRQTVACSGASSTETQTLRQTEACLAGSYREMRTLRLIAACLGGRFDHARKSCGILRRAWVVALPKLNHLGQTAAWLGGRFSPNTNPVVFCGMPARSLIRCPLAHRCSGTPLSSWERGRG